MKTGKKQQKLLKQQSKREKQLAKTEKIRIEFEKETRKLYKIELAITNLVRAQAPTQELHGKGQQKLRHAHLIFNPQSKGAIDGTYHLEAIQNCLNDNGIRVTTTIKTSGKSVRKHARAAVDQGVKLIIVASGDGTIEDVAEQLIGSETTLGIIPIGRMNNIARSLGVPLNLDDACTLLRIGLTRHVDIGRMVSPEHPNGSTFLEMAGIGLSAHALPLSQLIKKGQWGKFITAMTKAFSSTIGKMTIVFDDDDAFQAQTQLVTIANTPLFGENMFIGPDAKMDDGLLDIAIYSGMGKADLAQHFMAISTSKRIDDPRISIRRVQRIRISAETPLIANADLAVLKAAPAWDISVLPAALSVIVGNGVGLTLPVESTMIDANPSISGSETALPVASERKEKAS